MTELEGFPPLEGTLLLHWRHYRRIHADLDRQWQSYWAYLPLLSTPLCELQEQQLEDIHRWMLNTFESEAHIQ
jgi:hypothetical protein